MAKFAGLQTFDESGRQIVEITDRLPRILGQVRTNKVDGSITVNTEGNFFYQIVRMSHTLADCPPRVTAQGNTLSWLYLDVWNVRSDVIIFYGVY